MKISLQMELAEMRQRQELREAPSINTKSKRIAERKQLETSLAQPESSSEVYNRLYDMGKKR